jgi:hypothetical protein
VLAVIASGTRAHRAHVRKKGLAQAAVSSLLLVPLAIVAIEGHGVGARTVIGPKGMTLLALSAVSFGIGVARVVFGR